MYTTFFVLPQRTFENAPPRREGEYAPLISGVGLLPVAACVPNWMFAI